LKVSLSNHKSTLKLGDYIILTATLPDTLIVDNVEKNFRFIEPIKTIEELSLYCPVFIYDTLNRRLHSVEYTNIATNIEVISGKVLSAGSSKGNIAFSTDIPRQVEIKIKPKEKGIYYIELSPQPRKIRYNGDKRAKLITRFDVIDLHHDLLAKYLQPEDQQGYINSINEYYLNSGGIYGFRVE
jgi:hypothetical protein